MALGSTKRINNQDPIQRFFSSEVEQGETLHCMTNFGLRFATVRSLTTSISVSRGYVLAQVNIWINPYAGNAKYVVHRKSF